MLCVTSDLGRTINVAEYQLIVITGSRVHLNKLTALDLGPFRSARCLAATIQSVKKQMQ